MAWADSWRSAKWRHRARAARAAAASFRWVETRRVTCSFADDLFCDLVTWWGVAAARCWRGVGSWRRGADSPAPLRTDWSCDWQVAVCFRYHAAVSDIPDRTKKLWELWSAALWSRGRTDTCADSETWTPQWQPKDTPCTTSRRCKRAKRRAPAPRRCASFLRDGCAARAGRRLAQADPMAAQIESR